MKRSWILLLALAAAGIVASVGSARGAHSTPRSGALHVTKECSDYHGQVGEFCTITYSNLPEIVIDSTGVGTITVMLEHLSRAIDVFPRTLKRYAHTSEPREAIVFGASVCRSHYCDSCLLPVSTTWN